MKKSLFLILAFLPIGIFSQEWIQWSDDFSDGNFTEKPVWAGTTDNFIVNSSNQLQSNASTTSRSYLSTSSEVFDDATWEFWVKINYNPTSSNYSMVYLISDRENISGDVNGYYLQIGNTSKEISLYRQQGSMRSKIIDGVDGILNAASVEVQIRVTRTKEGDFSLFRKLPADADWVQEGTAATDKNVLGSNYFGVLFANSSATGKAYFFDNISVSGYKLIDEIPPVWTNLQITESNKLILTFSEAVDLSNADFQVNNEIGNPASVELSQGNSVVTLTFSHSFLNGIIYTLQANNVKDLAGNLLQETQKQVGIYEIPKAGDLIINEILFETADGVPEYFEIYNISDKILILDNTHFSTRSPSTGRFTLSNRFPANILLFPKTYLALTNNAVLVKEHFDTPATANIQTTTSWSALNNTSSRFVVSNLNIRTENGATVRDTVILDELAYDRKWHSVQTTPNVSLERINPDQRTQIPTNWHSASELVHFGTPGYENSRYLMPDTVAPVITNLIIQEPNEIFIQFSEFIDISTAAFMVDQEIGNSTELTISADEMSLLIPFGQSFEKGKVYTLEIMNIKDLAGNPLTKTIYQIGILENPEKSDLVINEILFDNSDNAAEYFEIYNSSEKVIDLSHVFFAIRNAAGKFSLNNYFPRNSFIAPHSYLALTTEPTLVRDTYAVPAEANIIKSERWSVLSNTGANFLIGNFIDKDTLVLDEVRYDAKWHHSLIRNTKGVSLERINPLLPSESASSWHSAAAEVHYGTPGYKNSQFREISAEANSTKKWFYPDPEAFSPDNDGIDDVCFIRYKTDAVGFTVNIIIFNSVGVKIAQLANNQVLGSEGFLIWNGKTDRGLNVNPGVYVLYVELINTSSGEKKVEKTPVVVSAR